MFKKGNLKLLSLHILTKVLVVILLVVLVIVAKNSVIQILHNKAMQEIELIEAQNTKNLTLPEHIIIREV